ncbi:hypothetical protein ACWGDE_27695 [Streptomyces sp. NPDC054956]
MYEERGSAVMRRGGGRGWPAAGAAAVALLVLGGCTGGDGGKWKEPAKGQAEALLSTAHPPGKNLGGAWLAFDGDPDGLTVGPDGKLYGSSASLAVIEDDHKARTIFGSETNGTGGLVVLSPNSFVVGGRSQLLNLQAGGVRTTVLAGAPDGRRKLGVPVPATAPAQDFQLSDNVLMPFGTYPDGSLLFVDGDVVWRLESGLLTRLYQAPPGSTAGTEDEQVIAPGAAVDHSGTVYLRSSKRGAVGRLGDVVTVGKDGSTGKLALPAEAAGVKTNPADLELTWMAGDDGNGVYVRVRDDSAQYVLHVAGGKAELVAEQASGKGSDSGSGSDSGCKEGHSVDAKKLPCTMPEALTYASGNLFMAGNAPFVLKIPTH